MWAICKLMLFAIKTISNYFYKAKGRVDSYPGVYGSIYPIACQGEESDLETLC